MNVGFKEKKLIIVVINLNRENYYYNLCRITFMEDEELNVEWKQKSLIILLEALNELEVRKGKNSTFTLYIYHS